MDMMNIKELHDNTDRDSITDRHMPHAMILRHCVTMATLLRHNNNNDNR